MSDDDIPIFVPVAFSEEQALHVLGAIRTIIQSAALAGQGKQAAPLAQAMVALAEATDKARERAAAKRLAGEQG